MSSYSFLIKKFLLSGLIVNCLWWRLGLSCKCSTKTAGGDDGWHDFHHPVLPETVSPHVDRPAVWLSVRVEGTGLAGHPVERTLPVVSCHPPWWSPTRQALHTATLQEQPTCRWFLTHPMTSKKLQCIDCAHLLMTSRTCSLTDKWLVTVTPSILIDVVRAISGRVGGRSVFTSVWRTIQVESWHKRISLNGGAVGKLIRLIRLINSDVIRI